MRDYWDQNVGRESCLSRCANFVQGSYFLRSCFQIRQNIDLCRKFAQRSNMAMSGGPKRGWTSATATSVWHTRSIHKLQPIIPPSLPSQIIASFADHVPTKHEDFGWIFHDFPCWEHFRHFQTIRGAQGETLGLSRTSPRGTHEAHGPSLRWQKEPGRNGQCSTDLRSKSETR